MDKTGQKSTIKLTKVEFDFVQREEYPLIKQEVIRKMSLRFDALGVLLRDNLSSVPAIAEHWAHPHFKTTKGENYKLLPFVVVDFPKISGADFLLTCRTMFWWGKYFSLNLIIRQDTFDLNALTRVLQSPAFSNVQLLTGDHLWEQDLDSEQFVNVQQADNLPALRQSGVHRKLSVRIPFTEWDKLEERAVVFYSAALAALRE